MLLCEFTGVDPLLISLVAIIGQLKSSIDSGDEKPDWTVDELLSFLKQNDVIIDPEDLRDMIKGPPLNQSISNIQGDKVVFKGQDSGTGIDKDQQKDIVKTMAHRATK